MNASVTLISPEFPALFLAFLPLYWAFGQKVRVQNALLLMAGYGFAAQMDRRFAVFMAAYSLAVWLLGMAVAGRRHQGPHVLRAALVLAVFPLALLKYSAMLLEATLQALPWLPAWLGQWNIALGTDHLFFPIGLSFYTLGAITWLVSLHRGEVQPAPLAQLALFLAFFPVLMAGPVLRAAAFLPQLVRTRICASLNAVMVLLVLAMLKKWWLAGYLAENWVNPAFDNPGQYHALQLLCAVYAYAAQIYLDFSGYSDLAMALALMLGFEIPRNFNAPYVALDLREFWRRWHISLSRWIRDYLYIPLGGSQRGAWRTQCNLTAAMLLSGLWHGAAWHYAIWGAMHAAGMVALNLAHKISPRRKMRRIPVLGRPLAQLATFHYVCLAWIFFRASDLDAALSYLAALWQNWFLPPPDWTVAAFLLALLGIWATQRHWVQLPVRLYRHLVKMPAPYKFFWFCACTLLVSVCAPPGIPGFIYAQF